MDKPDRTPTRTAGKHEAQPHKEIETMSKITAAITKAKFASKTKVAMPTVKVAPIESAEPVFVMAQRTDGTPSHNLEWLEQGNYLYLRIDLAAATIPSSKGNPLVSTSRGFVGIGSVNLSLNALKKSA